ncbi:hypothetical protein [Actinophytocola sp. KF-1]
MIAEAFSDRAADEILVAVEIISPGSRLTDTKVKRYDEPLSLAAHHLAGEFGYREVPAVSRVFETNEPFPVRIDLTELPDGPARQHGEGNQ